MLRISVQARTRRLFFFLLPIYAAQPVFASAYGFILETPSLSDRVPERDAVTQSGMVREESSLGAASSPVGERAADGAPDPERSIYHTLRRGQTLSSLSHLYRVPIARLLQANKIKRSEKIRAGMRMVIPPPDIPGRVERTVTLLAGELGWPLKGLITSRFGPRGKRSLHGGIDIDGEVGDEVTAAASGTVTQAGTKRKYGKMMVIEHGDGLSTVYAHMRKLLVRVGDRIDRGNPIAEVGRTGNARGSHLHFEVRRHDRVVDPIPYLERGTLIAAIPR